ncbi:MAG: FtsX-like permease family protein [Bacteroidaceae bacterium]|nr:FtsX-like permease family protein [Bacteroidaceae bacterium]
MKRLKEIIKNISIQFRRFKLASTLNLVELCIAISTFFLFITKVEEEVRYNTCFKDWRQIYRIEVNGKFFGAENDTIANLFAPMRNIVSTIPNVKDVGIMESSSTSITLKYHDLDTNEDKTYTCHYFNGYAEYLRFFNIEFIDSLAHHSDEDIIVPESFAMKTHGMTHISGKKVSWSHNGFTTTRRIAGVYKDFPRNCSVHNGFYQYGKNNDGDSFTNMIYRIYVRVEDDSCIPQIEKDILNKILELNNNGHLNLTYPESISVKLHDIHDAYFSGIDEIEDKGNWTMTKILFFSAILIFVLTNVNFINLTLAIAPMRIKNINTRRVLGASRMSIVINLMAESLFLIIFAFVISMTLLLCLDEVVVGNVNPLDHLRITGFTFVLIIWAAIVSSAYPAWFSTSFAPDIALKGTFGLTALSRRLRTIRISFQMIVCLVATTVITALLIQQQFILHADYGFNTDNVLYGTIQTPEAREHKNEIRRDIEQIEGVESVSYSKFCIGTDDRYVKWSLLTNDKKYNIFTNVMPVDRFYLKTLGIEITDGRDVCASDSGAFIFNEAARRKYPWLKTGHPMFPYDNDSPTDHNVVGFCKNIIFSSLRIKNDEEALMFFIPGKEDPYYNTLSTINIRIAEGKDTEELRDKINEVYNRYSGNLKTENGLNLSNIKDYLAKLYFEEYNFLIQLTIIAAIFMFITLIGVFCITLFECEYRRKEIAIRKVFGATTTQVTRIFLRKYLTLTICSTLISLPFSYMLIDKLMSRFTLHSEYTFLAFPIAFLLVALAILGTVAIQSYRAAKFRIRN